MKEHMIRQVMEGAKLSLVKDIKFLTDTAYILSVEKRGLDFVPGQYMTLGMPGSKEMREYSVYSGANDNQLEFLIKEVEQGDVSRELKYCRPGEYVSVDGPFGFFTLNKRAMRDRKFLFIASGTGISPFHSYVKSFGRLDYQLVHGIRHAEESYGRADYAPGRYIACTSRDKSGQFFGRVTDYLMKNHIDKHALCYLCGNSNMIYDVFDILRRKGIPSENVYMEVYF